MRKVLFEDWLNQYNFDFVVFPAAGDVGFAEADVDVDLAEQTWKNGVKYSNGNRALRHLRIPSVTVTMGMIPEKQMPMGLTFLGKAYNDAEILKAGYAFEQKRNRRVQPPLTPILRSDNLCEKVANRTSMRPDLQVTKWYARWNDDGKISVSIKGNLSFCRAATNPTNNPHLDIYVDANKVLRDELRLDYVTQDPANGVNTVKFSCYWRGSAPQKPSQRDRVIGRIARDSIMIILLARDGERGRPRGCLRLIHMDDITAAH